MVTDQVCIQDVYGNSTSEQCVSGFDFFLADSCSEGLHASGTLGLGPTSDGMPKSLATAMKEGGQISEETVSIWLNDVFDLNNTLPDLLKFGAVEDGSTKGKFFEHKIVENHNNTWKINAKPVRINNTVQWD